MVRLYYGPEPLKMEVEDMSSEPIVWPLTISYGMLDLRVKRRPKSCLISMLSSISHSV